MFHKRVLRAVTGQRGEGSRDGIFNILRELFIWSVLDHFNIT